MSTLAKSDAALLSRRWCRASRALDGGLRVAYLRSETKRYSLSRVAEALDELCTAAEQAEPEARELLVTLVDLLADDQSLAFSEKLHDEAGPNSLLALARLLRRPVTASMRAPPSANPQARVPDYGTGRVLTLGERKALARRPTRKAMDKLFADPHPAVIRTLLQNPRVVEDDVVRLAARRPGDPAVFALITQNRRWAHRVKVRMAIVLNPDTPAPLAIPLLALLVRPELQLVAEASGLAPTLRAAAGDLLMRRPPVRAPAKTGLQ